MNNDINVVGIIGYPLKQSLSPLLHNYWINAYKLNSCYLPFTIKNIKNIDKAIKTLNIRGLNVTIPYKKEIIKYLDEIDDEAKRLEAVNTIINTNGKLKGYNTDVFGFKRGCFGQCC